MSEEAGTYKVIAFCEAPPMDKPERFRRLTERMSDTYEAKNADYGDSFGRSVGKYGIIAALTRISDKFNRMENLILKGGAKVNESLSDTLMDMANYCLMTILEIENESKT